MSKRGCVYLDLKQYNNALIDFNKSLEIESNNAHALSRRGGVYKLLKQYEKALIDLCKSIEIELNNALREGRCLSY